MIFKTPPTSRLEDGIWRRINMRKVDHLIGAEMIHNLYGRYWPQINSIRFSNTKTIFKDGVVESFAPINEWAYLQKWVSTRFINLDPVIIRETKNIFNPTYTLTNELCERIDSADLQKISNDQLALLLIDILDIPLGEIYKLNVVQVEYGLNFALDVLLKEYEPDSNERNRLLAKLISPTQLTVAQEEEVTFGEIVSEVKSMNQNDLDTNRITELLKSHHSLYAGTRCAYGELPPPLEVFESKLVNYLKSNQEITTLEDAKAEVLKLHEASQDLLKVINDDRLTTLCNLMADIGVFRDKNKAKVGDTVLRRLRILEEISRRCEIDIKDLNLYLLTDLVSLLESGNELSKTELTERSNGVTFVREERLEIKPEEFISKNIENKSNKLDGICASPGIVNGIVKVITSFSDIDKMNDGDIMVAIGTDFDLIEIMHEAAGIITEEGGLLSHASVISRELKKPCLIGVSRATSKLKDGMHITLDATSGCISINE